MRPLVPLVLSLVLAPALLANESSYHLLQTGNSSGATPVHDHGIHGEGQIIADFDTGLDWDNCYFAEPDNSAPPVNLGVSSRTVDPSRRKVIAYDFLFSCAENPGAAGCDDPADPKAWDNQGHGTHAAASAAADRLPAIQHDYADAIAPAAKLVIQDAGYRGPDSCSQFPSLGCPIRDLRPFLEQAWAQGARIQSNEWGDRQGTSPTPGAIPPTGNYSTGSRDIDDFVWTHPDMVVVFNTGNAGQLGASSISAPGTAKNTIQVGGGRFYDSLNDGSIETFSGRGPARDGRVKPDLIGPAWVLAADSDLDVTSRNCDVSLQGGTSWSSPTIAGAAALVRQYYADGFYPLGVRSAANRFEPSAALVKATLIASARMVPNPATGSPDRAPSYDQGFGFPVLDDALYFAGDRRRLIAFDVGNERGLTGGRADERKISVSAGERLVAVLVWTDPPGVPRPATDPTPELVNDLDLRVTGPSGKVLMGNDAIHPGQPDRLNNVEIVAVDAPSNGTYRVSVSAAALRASGAQGYALVIAGAATEMPRSRAIRRGAVAAGSRPGATW